MEITDKRIEDLLDDFDKKLFADTEIDLNNLPTEVEGPDRRLLEINAYAE